MLTLLSTLALLHGAPAAAAGDLAAGASSAHPKLGLTIEAGQAARVGAEVWFTLDDGSSTWETVLTCTAPEGVDSRFLRCGHRDIPAEVVLETARGSVLVASLAAFERWAEANGYDVVDVAVGDDPGVHAAKAVWSWIGNWTCVLEDSDRADCASLCATHGGVESLTAKVKISNNNFVGTPQCEVRCECKDGFSDWHIDVPQSLTPE